MFLYKIENKNNNKIYVGITAHLKRRWREHKSKLNSGKHYNKHLQYAWKKYGKDSFSFEILSKFNNLEDMNKAEVEYIKENNLLDSKNGYNIGLGGNSFAHKEESKLVISKSQEKKVINKCLKTGKETVYSSIKEAEKDGFLNGISNACYDRNLTYRKHVWMFLEDHKKNPKQLQLKFKTRQNTKARKNRYKPVYGMCLETKEIKKYEAIDHVEKDGFSNQTVRSCLKADSANKTHNNWVWSHKEEDLEEKYKITKNGNKNRKNIYKFSLSGKLVKEIDRSLLTKKTINGIVQVCSGRKETYKGYRYSYTKQLLSKYTKRSFLKLTKDGVLLKKYINIQEVMKDNVEIKSTSSIYRCCNKERKTANGYMWQFGETHECT